MTKFVAFLAVACILAGLGYFFYTNDSQSQTTDATEQTGSASDAEGEFTGTLSDLATRGGDYRCTFTHDSVVAKSGGTVYISGSRIRGDFSSVVPQVNMTVESHMIQNDGYVYAWSPMSPSGMKAKAMTGGASGSAAMSGQGVDQNQAYTYNCEKWSVDASVFALPSGISFTEAN